MKMKAEPSSSASWLHRSPAMFEFVSKFDTLAVDLIPVAIGPHMLALRPTSHCQALRIVEEWWVCIVDGLWYCCSVSSVGGWVGVVDGSLSSSVVVIVNGRLGAGYCQWALLLASPLLLFPVFPLTCLRGFTPGVVNSNRFIIIDSCYSAGIELWWWNCVVVVMGFLQQPGGYKCQ